MLVYGDHSRRLDPGARLTEIAGALSREWLTHEQLLSSFIALAGVTQGIADAGFESCGMDRQTVPEGLLLRQLTELARTVLCSFEQGRAGAAEQQLSVPADLPDDVEVRLPEGYTFYALYPEAYGLAARRLQLSAPPRVIGLRSIGTGLACMAAAALGAPPPVTLRPTGDPFARSLRIAPELEEQLLDGEAHFIIVDEGPGLSGSSFGAVADWLEDRGVAPDRIAFLPGHSNPLGSKASERHRSRWARAQRPVVALDRPTSALLEPLIGPCTQPLTDISGGAWRPLWSASEADWPAVDPTWERRKFRAHSDRGQWLVKFAGLGEIGEAKLRLARDLKEAGFGPEVAGLAHGWLVTSWHEDAVPSRPSLDELVAYLRWRRTIVAPQPGACPAELLAMVRRNVPGLEQWTPDLTVLEPQYVCTDNRMAAHEWLRLPSGKLLKSDAVDHHAAHDLIGCQDIAWDVAGAIVELGLSPNHAGRLQEAIGCGGPLLDFHLIAYRAFRIGAHRLSAASLDHWPEEQRRNIEAAKRLERQLAAVDPVQHLGHVG